MPDPYPITIVKTRYQGVYEGGRWAAFNEYPKNIPYEASGDDLSCATWWRWGSNVDKVGVGQTVTEAYENLLHKIMIRNKNAKD